MIPLGRGKLIECSQETTLICWYVPRAPCGNCQSSLREPSGALLVYGMNTLLNPLFFIKWRNPSEVLSQSKIEWIYTSSRSSQSIIKILDFFLLKKCAKALVADTYILWWSHTFYLSFCLTRDLWGWETYINSKARENLSWTHS